MPISPSRAPAPFTQLIITILSLCLPVENTQMLPVEKAEFAKGKKRDPFPCYGIANS